MVIPATRRAAALLLALPFLHPHGSQDSAGRFAQGRVVESLPAILPLRLRADASNRILRERLEDLLPSLMREAGIDLWLVVNREANEDPVYLTLVPEPVFFARRTTILVFHDRGPKVGIERLTVSRYPIGTLYQSSWSGGSDDEQWARLAEIVKERDPKKIGIDVSRDWAYGDGLSAGLRDRLMEALGPLRERCVSAEDLCIRWLEPLARRARGSIRRSLGSPDRSSRRPSAIG